MRKISKHKLCNIIFIVTVIMTTFKVNAQNTVETLEISQSKVLSKNPILEAKLPSSVFQLGKPVELTLTIKNQTDSIINIFDAVPERGFDITVKNSKKLNLSLTKEGRKKKFPNIIMGRAGAYIEAGKELNFRVVNLNELFDFRNTGDYTLEVKVAYYTQNSSMKNKVSSNMDNILYSVVKFTVE